MMVFLGLGWSVFSQQDPVLMRIGGKDVLRSEFEYNYNRDKASLAPKYAAPEKYAERFVNFKLPPRRPGWTRLLLSVKEWKITATG